MLTCNNQSNQNNKSNNNNKNNNTEDRKNDISWKVNSNKMVCTGTSGKR